MEVGFNKPYLTGKETYYIHDAIHAENKISGNGKYTQLCHDFFYRNYGFKHCLLTTSCTDALEMCSLLLDISAGDEVIVPSYTFVSSANAFVLHFCDSRADHPGIDETAIEDLITAKTKAIVIVHYAGVAVDMDKVMSIANQYGIAVIEDVAHGIDSYFKNGNGDSQALGSYGQFATFSFHETKNIIAGEGGMLVINDDSYAERAEILWEKGTNRSAFSKGIVNKYEWVDKGSSFLPSDMIAAFLYAQLESLNHIQSLRKSIWNKYQKVLKTLAPEKGLITPYIPEYATNNAHMYY